MSELSPVDPRCRFGVSVPGAEPERLTPESLVGEVGLESGR